MIRYQQNREIAWRTIKGEAVLIDPADGVVFVLNRVGCRIWDLLEEPRSSNEVVERVASDYRAGQDRVEADVLPFLSDLARRGLVEEVS